MFLQKHTRHGLGASLALVLVATAIVALLPKVALAPPPGGGADGVIYFHRTIPYVGTEFWYMNADGSGKTALLAGVDGEPSFNTHGGSRWFLQFQETAELDPNGDPRVELFAVSEDLSQVQLTDEPDLQALDSTPRWTVDGSIVDGVVSWVARRWDGGPGGIYSVPVDYDVSGPVASAQPAALLVPGDDIASHDWAPGGISLVYRSAGGARGDGLWVVHDVTNPGGTTEPLGGDDYDPVWSPDGSKIAFKSRTTYPAWSIFTINPDGSGQKAVLEITPLTILSGPRWSPTGSHLLYQRKLNADPDQRDAYIAKANGKNRQNLTGDIDDDVSPVAWREGAGASSYCGDGNIDPGEDACNCPEDVPWGPSGPPDEICDDGLDNDCDGLIDCDDPDCGGDCPTQICTSEGDGWATRDGGCKDLVTGLVWSLWKPNYSWPAAMQYAEDLGEGGYTDWRLPTKLELETAAQHLAADHLPAAWNNWSSTEQGGRKAWTVDLTDGSSEAIRKSFYSGVYCVRQSVPE